MNNFDKPDRSSILKVRAGVEKSNTNFFFFKGDI